MLSPPVMLILGLDQLPARSFGDRYRSSISPASRSAAACGPRPSVAGSSPRAVDMTTDVLRPIFCGSSSSPQVLIDRLHPDRLVRTLARPGAEPRSAKSHPASVANWAKYLGECSQRPPPITACVWTCVRIGLVVGTDGGFITRMQTPFEFGLGGPLGSGRQWMSWIERDDLVRLIAHPDREARAPGPINATAPIRVTNTRFTEELGRRLHRPAIFRVPSRAAAHRRWRLRRRITARRRARAAEQGAEQRLRVPARDAAQRVRRDLVRREDVRSRSPSLDWLRSMRLQRPSSWSSILVMASSGVGTPRWRRTCFNSPAGDLHGLSCLRLCAVTRFHAGHHLAGGRVKTRIDHVLCLRRCRGGGAEHRCVRGLQSMELGVLRSLGLLRVWPIGTSPDDMPAVPFLSANNRPEAWACRRRVVGSRSRASGDWMSDY